MLPQNLGKGIKETNKQVVLQSLGLISSAFVLVAALAWNDLIKDVITTYLNTGSGLISRLIYAILVTIIAAIVAMRLNKLSQRLSAEENQEKQTSQTN
jgi:hypothetical protein